MKVRKAAAVLRNEPDPLPADPERPAGGDPPPEDHLAACGGVSPMMERSVGSSRRRCADKAYHLPFSMESETSNRMWLRP